MIGRYSQQIMDRDGAAVGVNLAAFQNIRGLVNTYEEF